MVGGCVDRAKVGAIGRGGRGVAIGDRLIVAFHHDFGIGGWRGGRRIGDLDGFHTVIHRSQVGRIGGDGRRRALIVVAIEKLDRKSGGHLQRRELVGIQTIGLQVAKQILAGHQGNLVSAVVRASEEFHFRHGGGISLQQVQAKPHFYPACRGRLAGHVTVHENRTGVERRSAPLGQQPHMPSQREVGAPSRYLEFIADAENQGRGVGIHARPVVEGSFTDQNAASEFGTEAVIHQAAEQHTLGHGPLPATNGGRSIEVALEHAHRAIQALVAIIEIIDFITVIGAKHVHDAAFLGGRRIIVILDQGENSAKRFVVVIGPRAWNRDIQRLARKAITGGMLKLADEFVDLAAVYDIVDQRFCLAVAVEVIQLYREFQQGVTIAVAMTLRPTAHKYAIGVQPFVADRPEFPGHASRIDVAPCKLRSVFRLGRQSGIRRSQCARGGGETATQLGHGAQPVRAFDHALAPFSVGFLVVQDSLRAVGDFFEQLVLQGRFGGLVIEQHQILEHVAIQRPFMPVLVRHVPAARERILSHLCGIGDGGREVGPFLASTAGIADVISPSKLLSAVVHECRERIDALVPPTGQMRPMAHETIVVVEKLGDVEASRAVEAVGVGVDVVVDAEGCRLPVTAERVVADCRQVVEIDGIEMLAIPVLPPVDSVHGE